MASDSERGESGVMLTRVSTDQLIQDALGNFKSTLTENQRLQFERKKLRDVQIKILAVQNHQERVKGLMNFVRMKDHIDRFAEFDEVCRSAQIGGELATELSDYIWGPSEHILTIAQEDSAVLTTVLDSFSRFGDKIPSLRQYKDLIAERPQMVTCVAFMYRDLLQFYMNIIQNLSIRGWKKLFQINWKYQESSFEKLVENFDHHSKVLKNLLDVWKREQDRQRQQNQHHHNHNVDSAMNHMIGISETTGRRLNDYVMNQNQHNYTMDGLMNQVVGATESTNRLLSRHLDTSETTGRRLNDHVMNQNRHNHTIDGSMNHLIDTTERTNQLLSHHVDASSQAFQRLIEQYEKLIVDSSSRAEEAEKARRKKHQEEVLAWLGSEVQQSAYHREFLKVSRKVPKMVRVPGIEEVSDTKMKEPGTAVWIVDETKIDNWINEACPTYPVMWLRGKKGAGKTILASTIIEHCMTKKEEFKTSYFYCREGEGRSNQNTAVAILREFLRQLLVHNQDPLPSCLQKKAINPEQVVTNIDTIKFLLDLFCETTDLKQFIIIDGLDECHVPEMKLVVKFWVSMVEKVEAIKPGNLRVLFVSQYSADIRKLIEKIEKVQVQIFDIPPEQSEKDIRKFVRYRLNKLQESHGLEDQDADSTLTYICAHADGMFLYAALVMQNLEGQFNIEGVKKELKAIPRELGEAYRKILDNLKENSPSSHWIMAKKIFGLLAGAGRPLKWHELQAALSITIEPNGKVSMDFYNLKLRDDVTKICGRLVQKVQRDRLEFIHSTTRQYILGSQHLDEKVIQCELTVLSLKYLTLECFQSDLNDDDIEQFIRGGLYAFQDYAIAEWGPHLSKFIEITAKLFPNSLSVGSERELENYEEKVLDAMESFLRFHKASIEEAAREKTPPPVTPKGHRRTAWALRAAQSASLPSLAPPPASQPYNLHPPSTQQSSSSRSVTPPQPQPEQQQQIDPAAHCKEFEHLSFHPQLVELWAHVCKHEKRDFKLRPMVSLPDLQKLLETVRAKIAEIGTTLVWDHDKLPPTRKEFQEIYGERHYKCSRVRCDFFYEGFESRGAAESHSNKHDRPYPCPIEGCSMVPFGFQTHKDKDRHVRNYHPEESDQPPPFVYGQQEGRATAEAKWPCDLCGKKFTRQSILKDHKDAHYGERKHACETCGKKFTRSNDRNRHRKIHVRKLTGRA